MEIVEILPILHDTPHSKHFKKTGIVAGGGPVTAGAEGQSGLTVHYFKDYCGCLVGLARVSPLTAVRLYRAKARLPVFGSVAGWHVKVGGWKARGGGGRRTSGLI
ncbi:Uncharacterized protein APZ42_034254 [Daphnia magna]|uniref:Uncharacterized protein n=1 Tax=Daphnia magna TaxID=35525 RepID=A0A164KBY3_9CRUS|nr:Uncharacterized protein APZ42_034254 [Daphnia magna]